MDLRVVVLSGLSGSGKTTAMAALEDLGFFCVDNLPPQLIASLIELWARTHQQGPGIAVVVDSRSGDFLPEIGPAVASLRGRGVAAEVLFLLASDDALQRRFHETRRRHPLLEGDGTMAAIRRERSLLEPLRADADRVIDTTDFGAHDLSRALRETYGAGETLRVRIQSFGFKHGAPRDANLMMDVRFLPNPFYDEQLRDLDGRDTRVVEYALGSEGGREFTTRWADMLEFLLPHYEREGKPTLNVAIGCTGGRHRSVAVSEWLARRLRKSGRAIMLEHRDIDRHG